VERIRGERIRGERIRGERIRDVKNLGVESVAHWLNWIGVLNPPKRA